MPKAPADQTSMEHTTVSLGLVHLASSLVVGKHIHRLELLNHQHTTNSSIGYYADILRPMKVPWSRPAEIDPQRLS